MNVTNEGQLVVNVEHQFTSANALVAGAFSFVLLFEILEPKVLFLRERIIPSRSVELHM